MNEIRIVLCSFKIPKKLEKIQFFLPLYSQRAIFIKKMNKVSLK